MKLSFFLLFILISSYCFGQSKQITGKVTDSFGASLPGVNIVIKGSADGTVTDNDGNYSLKVKPGDALIISFVGYSTEEVIVGNGQSVINIVVRVSGNSLHGWCCTDHSRPDGPHCGKTKDELKNEFGCIKFVPDN